MRITNLLTAAGLLLAFHSTAHAQIHSFRGVSLEDLGSRDGSFSQPAVDKLNESFGADAKKNRWSALSLEEAEIETLLSIAEQIFVPYRRVGRRQVDPTGTGRRAYFYLARDVLSRSDDQRCLSLALQAASYYKSKGVWLTLDSDLDFTTEHLGIEAAYRSVKHLRVGANHIATALIMSEVATPELLLELIAMGKAQPLDWEQSLRDRYRLDTTWSDEFVCISGYVIAEKLKRAGDTTLSLKIADDAPQKELALEVKALVGKILDPKTTNEVYGGLVKKTTPAE